MAGDLNEPERLTHLQRSVTKSVMERLGRISVTRADIVARLQEVEEAVWITGADRQTLQVITSGRRLLGDAKNLTPAAMKREPSEVWLAGQLRCLPFLPVPPNPSDGYG